MSGKNHAGLDSQSGAAKRNASIDDALMPVFTGAPSKVAVRLKSWRLDESPRKRLGNRLTRWGASTSTSWPGSTADSSHCAALADAMRTRESSPSAWSRRLNPWPDVSANCRNVKVWTLVDPSRAATLLCMAANADGVKLKESSIGELRLCST